MLIAVCLALPWLGLLAISGRLGSTLFSWHPFIMACAFSVLFCFAVEIRTTRLHFRYKTRMLLHWWSAAAGVLCAIIGFCVIFVNKQYRDAPHLTSLHGKCGAVVLAWALVQAGVGLLVIQKPNRRAGYKHWVRFLHRVSGAVLVAAALWVSSLAVDSAWFTIVAPSWARVVVLPLLLAQSAHVLVCAAYLC